MMPATYLSLTEEESSDRVVVRAHGEVDAATAPQFAGALSRAADEAEERTLVIDLTETEFMDVKGFAALLNAHRKIDSQRGEMFIVCPLGQVRRMLGLLDTSGRLRLCASADARGARAA